jgi:hypothetical protein
MSSVTISYLCSCNGERRTKIKRIFKRHSKPQQLDKMQWHFIILLHPYFHSVRKETEIQLP